MLKYHELNLQYYAIFKRSDAVNSGRISHPIQI